MMYEKIYIGVDVGTKGLVSFYRGDEVEPFDYIYFRYGYVKQDNFEDLNMNCDILWVDIINSGYINECGRVMPKFISLKNETKFKLKEMELNKENRSKIFEIISRYKKYDMKNFSKDLVEIIACYDQVYACIENVHHMPGDGGVGSFNFGKQFGWITSVFNTLNIPYILVEPAAWKRHFDCIVTSEERKSLTSEQSKLLKKQKVVDYIETIMHNSAILSELRNIKTPTGKIMKKPDIEFYDGLAIGKFCQEKFDDIYEEYFL